MTLAWGICIVLVMLCLVLGFFAQRQMHEGMRLNFQQMDDMRRVLHEGLTHFSATMGTHLGNHSNVMLEVKGQLGGLAETAKNIQTLSRDIGGLQDILRDRVSDVE